jgi:hypothetical protein
MAISNFFQSPCSQIGKQRCAGAALEKIVYDIAMNLEGAWIIRRNGSGMAKRRSHSSALALAFYMAEREWLISGHRTVVRDLERSESLDEICLLKCWYGYPAENADI